MIIGVVEWMDWNVASIPPKGLDRWGSQMKAISPTFHSTQFHASHDYWAHNQSEPCTFGRTYKTTTTSTQSSLHNYLYTSGTLRHQPPLPYYTCTVLCWSSSTTPEVRYLCLASVNAPLTLLKIIPLSRKLFQMAEYVVCSGVGKILCGHCYGTGSASNEPKCYRCDGSGWVTCSACEDSGKN